MTSTTLDDFIAVVQKIRDRPGRWRKNLTPPSRSPHPGTGGGLSAPGFRTGSAAGPADVPTGRRKPSRLVDAVRLPKPAHSDRRVRRFRRATAKYPGGKPEPFELRFGKREDGRFTGRKETFSVNFRRTSRTVRRIRRPPPHSASGPLWIKRTPGFPVLTRA